MPLLSVVVVLVACGVLLWMVNSIIPMEQTVRKIINVVVIIAIVFWLLSLFGLFGSLSSIRVGR